jgi:hypothetical protein
VRVRANRVFLLVSLLSVPALAQPLGPEFRVNTYTGYGQRQSAVAADASGAFLVVWAGSPNFLNTFVYGQRYSSTGTPLGGEFRVSAGTGKEYYPSVAPLSPGGFVVVWDRSNGDVFGQRFDASGAPLGTEFRVNTYTMDQQRLASVASNAAGEFVVVWESRYQDGSQVGVFGQRFASSGAKAGPEFHVNTYTTNNQQSASVAYTSGGEFVVVWDSTFQDDPLSTSILDVYAQLFGSSGAPLGGEFRVNTYTTEQQRNARVASDSSGNFVVVWQGQGQGDSGFGVFARRFASSGAPLGGDLPINVTTAGAQTHPSVASDGAGNLVVAWASYPNQTTLNDVLYRSGPDALRLGTELRANTFTTNDQTMPAVTFAGPGKYVLTWTTVGQFGIGSDNDVVARRFTACSSSDEDGNAKRDVSDVFYLINALFAGGPAPVCGGDVDGNGKADVADVFYLINFLFAGGPPPVQ